MRGSKEVAIKQNCDVIIEWLRKCDELKIEPWLWDFKEELIKKKGEQNDNAIMRIFEWYLDRGEKYHSGETEDTDLALSIYSILWDIEIDVLKQKRLDRDVMNSFWTTYKCALQLNNKDRFLGGDTEKPDIQMPPMKGTATSRPCLSCLRLHNSDKSVISKCFYRVGKNKDNQKYIRCESFIGTRIKDLMDDELLCRFTKLTHTIGNFTLEPKGFNTGRGGYDYWDYAIELLRDNKPLGLDINDYIDKFFMNSYVYDDYSTALLFGESLKGRGLPSVYSFLSRISDSIEERGKYMMMKLCEIIIKSDLSFKGELEKYFFYESMSNATIDFGRR